MGRATTSLTSLTLSLLLLAGCVRSGGEPKAPAASPGESASLSAHDVADSNTVVRPGYPSPFGPSTTLTLVLDQADSVRVVLYDLEGKPVAVVLDEVQGAGVHSIRLGGLDLPSGSYLYRVRTSHGVEIGRITLIR